jgi:hypothetical protein
MTREIELLQRQNETLQQKLEEGNTRIHCAAQVPVYLCSSKYVVIHIWL